MRHARLAALPGLLLVASPGSAQSAPAAPAPPHSNDVSKMVCKTVEATGSRLSKRRECHTASEWTEINAASRQEIERRQANRYSGNAQ